MNYKKLVIILLIASSNAFSMEKPEEDSGQVMPFHHAALFTALVQEAQTLMNQSDHIVDEKSVTTEAISQKRTKCTCPECGKSFSSSYLTEHMRIHTGEKPFECDQCSYSCARSRTLTSHMRIHAGLKPFKCDQCNYSCIYNSDLIKHRRIHTGEKPYKCDQCDYSCKQSSSLKTHIQTHTGEKPYHCNQCNYSCAVNSNLTKHMRTHSGEKPYKCNQCTYSCTLSGTLTRHVRIDHAIKKSKQSSDLIWHEEKPSEKYRAPNDLARPTISKTIQ